MSRTLPSTAAALLVLLATACSGAPAPSTPVAPTGSATGAVESPSPTSAGSPAPADVPGAPAGLAVEQVAEGLRGPVFLTAPPGDERLFVLEQSGRVLVLVEGGEPEVFLDLEDRVRSGGERGLLGLAFHPRYADTGRFFVHHTDLAGDTAVVEYRVSADPDRAEPEPVTTVLSVPQPAGNHNGGMLTFGPDGMLYLALGDGGAAGDRFGNGQRPDTLLGAILRLDVDAGTPYAIPPDNPFAAGGGGAPEVWHYGLRNPWRFSFDPVDGLLYIADVGQDRFEEVSVVPADVGGLNFGWPIAEASACFQPREGCDLEGLIPPVLEYETGRACAVIGGYVYRGEDIPGLQGHYLYSDVCAGFVRSFRYVDGEATDLRDWAITGLDGRTGEVVSGFDGPTSFGVDGRGELYLTTGGGSVFRLVPAPT